MLAACHSRDFQQAAALTEWLETVQPSLSKRHQLAHKKWQGIRERCQLIRSVFEGDAPDEARQRVERALEHSPDSSVLHYLQGHLAKARGDRETAQAAWEFCLRHGLHYDFLLPEVQ